MRYLQVLLNLNRQDLVELGLASVGHRKIIETEIGKLNATSNVSQPQGGELAVVDESSRKKSPRDEDSKIPRTTSSMGDVGVDDGVLKLILRTVSKGMHYCRW